MEFVSDLVVIVIAGIIGGIAAKILRQPLILGYIVAGIFVSPNTPGYIIKEITQIQTLAEVGVALLLFSLGIEFSVKDLMPIRKIAFLGAPIQVAFTLLLGYVLGLFFGWSQLASFCLAITIISSSTAVILKSLVAVGHVGSLSGRVMLGMSIVQDVLVLPLMIVLISAHSANNGESGGGIAFIMPIVNVLIFTVILVLVGGRVIPAFLKWIASWRSQELFILSVVSVSLGVGYISFLFGLSLSFGAFAAGLVLANSDYGHKALSDMIPLRDVFGLLFFVSIGILLDPMFVLDNWQGVFVLVAVACLGRGLILGGLAWSFGYRNVIPIAAVLGMLPISEIGFVVTSSAMREGIIDMTVYSYLLNMIILSMLIGPPVSSLTGPIYSWSRRMLSKKNRNLLNANKEMSVPETTVQDHVIIAGGRYLGRYIGRVLKKLNLPYVIIEPNHQNFVMAQDEQLSVIYGDPHQPSILNAAKISSAKILLITAETRGYIRFIVETAKDMRPDIRFIVQYEGYDGAELMDELGIDEIVQPEYEVGIEMLRQALVSLDITLEETERQLEQVRHQLTHKGMRENNGQ